MSALAKRLLELERKYPGDPESPMELPAKLWAELIELARAEAPRLKWTRSRDAQRELVWHFGDYSVHVIAESTSAKPSGWGVKHFGEWVSTQRLFRTLREAKRYCECDGQSRSFSRRRS